MSVLRNVHSMFAAALVLEAIKEAVLAVISVYEESVKFETIYFRDITTLLGAKTATDIAEARVWVNQVMEHLQTQKIVRFDNVTSGPNTAYFVDVVKLIDFLPSI